MPTYEYQCGKCGVFEISQRMADPALTKCPTCRRKVQRLISASNFAFKGTGWYVTDYGRKGASGGSDDGGNSGASTSGDSSSSSEGKSESKSESQTESKTDTKSAAKETKDSKEKKPKAAAKEKSGS